MISRRAGDGPPPQTRPEFWRDFARRLEDRPAVATGKDSRFAGRLRLGLSLAAALLVAAAVWLGRPAPAERAGTVLSLSLEMPHQAVFILDAPDAPAAIIWIEGLEIEGDVI